MNRNDVEQYFVKYQWEALGVCATELRDLIENLEGFVTPNLLNTDTQSLLNRIVQTAQVHLNEVVSAKSRLEQHLDGKNQGVVEE